MAPYEILYGRRCRSPIGWFEAGETNLLGPNLVQEAIFKVQLIGQRLLIAQRRQKSYVDKRRRDLVFPIGDKVFLRVSPMKGVMRFGKRVFHVSMLRKCISDSSQMLEAPAIPLDVKVSYKEEPMAIVNRQLRKLRNRDGKKEKRRKERKKNKALDKGFKKNWGLILKVLQFSFDSRD
ncbi:uncharacterized protein [Nicotiana sylvestris]|uniref:uncharacterized protein n=1 Tax=Nicotiana sylvestris TaxID=4096 RepID=UPI00388C8F5B